MCLAQGLVTPVTCALWGGGGVRIGKNLNYEYEIRVVLVPILHGVKFTKCETYGSTVLSECERNVSIFISNLQNFNHGICFSTCILMTKM